MARDSRRRSDEDDEDDRPRRRRGREEDEGDRRASRSHKSDAGTNPWLIWGPVAAIAAVGLGIGIYFLMKGPRKSESSSEVAKEDPKQEIPKPPGPPKFDVFPPVDPKPKLDPRPKPFVDPNPKPKVDPNPKVVEDDARLLKRATQKLRLDLVKAGLEKLFISDRGDIIGISSTSYEGGKKLFFDRFDVASGRRMERLQLPPTAEWRQHRMSPDGQLLLHFEQVAVPFRTVVTIWALPEQKPLVDKLEVLPKKDALNPILFSDFISNDRFITVSGRGRVDFWTLPDGKLAGSVTVKVPNTGLQSQDPYTREFKDVALSNSRKLVAIWNGDGFSLIDTQQIKELGRTPGLPGISSNSMEIKGTAFNIDGTTLHAWISTRRNPNKMDPDVYLVDWNVSDLRQGVIQPIVTTSYLAQYMTWWGPNHLLLHRGIPGQSILFDHVKGQPICEIMGPFGGKYAFTRNGSHWYLGAESDQTNVYVNRIDFPMEAPSLGAPYINGNMRRLWLTPDGISQMPFVNDVRSRIGLIPEPRE